MRISHILALLVVFATLSGCAVKPKPISEGERSSFSAGLHASAYSDQEPIQGGLSIYEAMARALKYNLDLKAEMYEEALKARQYDRERVELLPSLVGNVAGRDRSNAPGGTAINVPTGDRTGGPNTSGSRANQLTSDLELSWDILDFGLSYVRAKQAGNEILIAQERRRKVAARLLEDVRSSYWRAVSAEHLAQGLKDLSGRVTHSLRRAQELENSGETSPIEALTYQRELIEITSRIQDLEDQSSVAKIQLAALMNLPPGVSYKLDHTPIKASSLRVSADDGDLVSLALNNRSEVAEVIYELRSNSLEAQKALLEILPSAKAIIGVNFDANNLLLHQSWVPWGATVSANLMNVFKLPARQAAVEAGKKRLNKKALALTVAIVTQVHVSKARFAHAKRRFKTADQHQKVQRKILAQVKNEVEAGTLSEKQLIREQMNALSSRARFDIAYAQMQNTFANVHAAVGIDPLTQGIDSRNSVDKIANQLKNFWSSRGDISALAKIENHKARSGELLGQLSGKSDAPSNAIASNAKKNIAKDKPVNVFKKFFSKKTAKTTSQTKAKKTVKLAAKPSLSVQNNTNGDLVTGSIAPKQEIDRPITLGKNKSLLPKLVPIPKQRPQLASDIAVRSNQVEVQTAGRPVARATTQTIKHLPRPAPKKPASNKQMNRILDAHKNQTEMVLPASLAKNETKKKSSAAQKIDAHFSKSAPQKKVVLKNVNKRDVIYDTNKDPLSAGFDQAWVKKTNRLSKNGDMPAIASLPK